MATYVSNDKIWADIVDSTTASAKTTSRTPSSNLDKDAFLSLLITQMRYQDPLSPMDNTQFLAQMAQFTALEQMTNLNKTMSLSQGYSMIGKTVYGTEINSTTGVSTEVFGTVDAVTMRSGVVYLTIGEKEITLDSVVHVGQDRMLDSINSLNNSQNVSLIGKYVQAIIMDGDKPKEFIEGEVAYVKFNGSVPILVIGDKEVYPSEVVSVSNGMMLIGKPIDAYWKDPATGEFTVIKGSVSGVKLADDKAYLLVDGKEIEIEKINYVTEALRMIGGDIKFGDVSGKVDSIHIKNKIPYLRVMMEDEEGNPVEQLVSFVEYKGIKTEK